VSDDHSSFDELADLDEGLLAPSRADEVRAHLAGCADCRARHQALRDVHDELAVLPPETMPPAVTERLDRALAAAAAPRSATVVPLDQHRRRRRGPALAQVAAVVVVLGFVVAVAVGALGGGSTSDGGAAGGNGSATSSGAARLPQTTGHFTKSVTSRTLTHTSVPAVVPRLVAGGFHALATVSGSPAASPPGSGSGSGANAPAVTASPVKVPKPLLPLFNSPAKLVACAAAVAPTKGSLPEAVVFGHYTNAAHKTTPSVFFVFADGATRGDIVVVGPSCAGLQQTLDFFHGIPIG
jgi:anti-sigma factor RsiW